MNFPEKIRNFVIKLQHLPETQKKVIIFAVVIFFGLIMGYFWIQSAKVNLAKVGKSLQSIDFPEISLPQDIQTQIEISDWKTYINNQYGFEIKYPNNISFIEPEYSYNIGDISFYYNDDPHNGPLVITILENEESSNEEMENKIPENKIIGEKNVGGNIGIVTIYGDPECQRITVNRGQISYSFIDNCNKDKNLFNLMLSTFKFINPKS